MASVAACRQPGRHREGVARETRAYGAQVVVVSVRLRRRRSRRGLCGRCGRPAPGHDGGRDGDGGKVHGATVAEC